MEKNQCRTDTIDEDELENEYEALCNEVQLPSLPEAPTRLPETHTSTLLQPGVESELVPLTD